MFGGLLKVPTVVLGVQVAGLVRSRGDIFLGYITAEGAISHGLPQFSRRMASGSSRSTLSAHVASYSVTLLPAAASLLRWGPELCESLRVRSELTLTPAAPPKSP